MADIFISYKSERRAAAEHLAEILADYGYSVWWDYGLVSGRDFGAQIEKELRAAKAVIVLWCSLSVGSEWVREEAALAKRLNKVIPTFIEHGVELPLGFSLSQTLDLAEWDGSPKNARLDRLLRDIGRFVGRAPKPNLPGLERTERAWRRFGAPPLREFALISELERKLPPRTLPGALFSQDDDRPRDRRKGVSAVGGVALALLVGAAGVWYYLSRPAQESVAAVPQPAQPSIEGAWVGEGQSCDYQMRLVLNGDTLSVISPGAPASSIAITRRDSTSGLPGEVDTAEGVYFRRGETLVLRLPDGSEAVFNPCT